MCRVHRSIARVAALCVLLLVLAAPRADARPRSAADDKLIEALLGHGDKLSSMLEKDLVRPKKALTAVEKYLRKHRKAMKKAVAKLVVAAGELDPDDRSTVTTDLLWSERTSRMIAAILGFTEKHGEDPAFHKRIHKLLDELESEGATLMKALL